MGAPYLAASSGKVYWELRIVEAKNLVGVGFAGTSFRSGPQAPKDDLLGGDEASWALYADDGQRLHG